VYHRTLESNTVPVVRRMPLHIYQVDSFTRNPFSGNPAGVCIVNRFPSDDLMQKLAAEMNLSETAFAVPDGPEGRYQLRWFTPAVEVELCGHATLATAHVIWELGLFSPDGTIVFETHSGLLSVIRGDGGLIQMDFPGEAPSETEVPEGLLDALGTEAIYVGRNRMDLIVEVADEATLRSLRPNFSRLEEIPARGVIVTSRANMDADFVSRFFAPQSGVPEDPVTGSAHCCLGPYWAERLGKVQLTGYQASRRGGFVYVEVAGPRVLLSGHAVTVMRVQTDFS